MAAGCARRVPGLLGLFTVFLCMAVPAWGGGELVFVESQRDGDGGTLDALNGAVGTAVSPDGNHVYVTGSVDDSVVVFERNATTGELTFLEAHRDGMGGVGGLSGAEGIALSPDGAHLYVAGEYDNAFADGPAYGG